jgi:hypothetical protein
MNTPNKQNCRSKTSVSGFVNKSNLLYYSTKGNTSAIRSPGSQSADPPSNSSSIASSNTFSTPSTSSAAIVSAKPSYHDLNSPSISSPTTNRASSSAATSSSPPFNGREGRWWVALGLANRLKDRIRLHRYEGRTKQRARYGQDKSSMKQFFRSLTTFLTIFIERTPFNPT